MALDELRREGRTIRFVAEEAGEQQSDDIGLLDRIVAEEEAYLVHKALLRERLAVVGGVLAQLPEWQPHAGFAHRVAALGLAACVSIAAWLGGEMLSAALRSAEGQKSPGLLSWMLAMASLVVA